MRKVMTHVTRHRAHFQIAHFQIRLPTVVRPTLIGAAAVGAMVWAALPVAEAGAASAAKAAPASASTPSATRASSPAMAPSRTSAAASVLDRLRAGGPAVGGARARLRELPVREISLDTLAGVVLGQNLDVLSAAEGLGIAQALVTQSDAVFDPTLFSSLTYTNRYNNSRRDVIGRFRDQDPGTKLDEENRQRKAQEEDSDPTNAESSFQCLPTVSIDGEVQTPTSPGCQLPPLYSVEAEFASYDSRSDHKAIGTLGGALQFPFGGSASLSLSTTWHKPISMGGSGNPALTSACYPGETGACGGGMTYDPWGWDNKLFWTASAGISLSLPLPFTKGFGYEGSPNSFNLRLAQSGERRAGWVDRSVRNSTLSQALQGYWDLVQSVQTLRTLIELRTTLDDRLASQKRLFDSGLATRYDLAQIETQQASLEASEESAWNQYLTVSNRLQTLLATGQRQLLMPANGEALLERPVTVDGTGAYERALSTHPDIKIQEEDLDASKATLAFRENQVLPDLSLTSSFGVTENDSVFGYENIGQALTHLFKPDTNTFFVGVRYRLPFGNNQAEGALSRARLEEGQAWDRTRQTRQRVVNAVDQAVGETHSAKSVAEQSDQDLKLAEFAYDRAREQRELGLVPEFEVLNKYSDLATARLNRITARAELQRARVRLLAAQGILEQGL